MRLGLLTSLLLLSLVWGCSTPPLPAPIRLEERIRQDNAVGQKLAGEIEPRLRLKNDVEVSVYLRRLAVRIAERSDELKDSPLGVLFVSAPGQWRNFAIPGNRIYLSVELMRQLEFENEAAAAIAMELGHLISRDLVIRLERLSDTSRADSSLRGEAISGDDGVPQFFGPGGALNFSADENIRATETGINIMYQAGIDPRGMVRLLSRYMDHIQYSPYDKQMLEKLLETSRQSIASFAPLRNPIVSSDSYEEIKKRIMKL
jgi:predicted Zn-dependent protease